MLSQEKIFKIADIFENISIAISSDLGNLSYGNTPFIGRTGNQNGIQAEVEVSYSKIIAGNCLSISMVGTNVTKYHPYSFTCSQNILILRSKKLNRHNAMYLVSVLDKYLFSKGYGYGHPVSLKRFRKDSIPLPVNLQDQPDFAFMESFMRQKEQEKLAKYKVFIIKRLAELQDYKEVGSLKDRKWKEFEIEDVFHIKSGVRLTKADMNNGNKPFIGATDSNNGITEFTSSTNSSEDNNVLGVNYNGSVVENFYHPYTAIFSDDVKRLSFRGIDGNKHLYLFAKNQILKQRAKYQYGYKFNAKRMSKQKIMLPVNPAGQPDYQFMENYMKQLEYARLQKYLTYKSLN